MTQVEVASPLIRGRPPSTAGVEGLRAYRQYPPASEGGGERFHGVPVLSFDVERSERALAAEELAAVPGGAPNVQNSELTSSFATAEHRVI